MKAIKFFGLIAIILVTQSISAQEQVLERPHRLVFTEVGGLMHGGLPFTLNYSMRFNSNNHLGWGFRVGAGVMADRFNFYGGHYPWSVFHFPVGVNYVFGNVGSRHTFEAGVIIAYQTDNAGSGGATLMWRRLPVGNRGLTFHAGLNPIPFAADPLIILLLGSSFGVGFAF
jgi:hypothetical protein